MGRFTPIDIKIKGQTIIKICFEKQIHILPDPCLDLGDIWNLTNLETYIYMK